MPDKAYSLIISSKSQKELTDSWKWYEERMSGLGDRFLAEVLKVFQKIEDNPDRYSTRIRSYKEVSVETFPFLVIFRVSKKANQVRVVSVFHTARNPTKKYR